MMLQTVMNGFVERVKTLWPTFPGKVIAFQGEREQAKKYPYIVVDISEWKVDYVFNGDEITTYNAVDYLVHQDGLAVATINLSLGAQKKNELLIYTEKLLSILQPQMNTAGRVDETGVFFEIQEATTKTPAKIRIENFELGFDYSNIDTDRYEASITVVVTFPWVRIFEPTQDITPPGWKLGVNVQWTIL